MCLTSMMYIAAALSYMLEYGKVELVGPIKIVRFMSYSFQYFQSKTYFMAYEM